MRTLAVVLLTGLSAAVPLVAQQPATPATSKSCAVAFAPRELSDLAYVTGGVEHQRLNLFLTPTPGGPARPLVVWIHGGGWSAGGRQECPAERLVARGYAVASLGYRFSQEAIYPAQIEDCKAAIRWLRAHAGEYGIDSQRVGVSGASAGGHLAALLGTTGNTRQYDVGENLDQSSAVRCVVDLCGLSDFLHWGDPPVSRDRDTPDTAVAHLIGGPIYQHVDAAKAASPVYYVNKDSAPFLIMACDQDPVVPSQQSRELDATLREAGVESTLVIVPGGGHVDPAFGSPENARRIDKFFDQHLRSPSVALPPVM